MPAETVRSGPPVPLPEFLLDDLRLDAGRLAAVRAGEPGPAAAGVLRVELGDLSPGEAGAAARLLESAVGLAPDGTLLVSGGGAPADRALAALRNRLWPHFHVQAVLRMRAGQPVERTEVGGTRRLAGVAPADGWLARAARRVHALSPQVTSEKFDRAAAGWNGEPGTPAYGHFRWMRRLVAVCARPAAGERALDAGSGAGWVGLEAALLGARLSAFDPSPEMVRLVHENAAALGVPVDARVGFIEAPPFAEPFDLVLNSGVISFAPDPDVFLTGLDRMVRPGGRLVIGDVNPLSIGFRRRRRDRLVVPVRELNGLPRDAVRDRLRARGYRIEWVRYYQNTWPVPELLHRTRSGALGNALLQLNRASSALDARIGSPGAALFDSWLIGARKGTPS